MKVHEIMTAHARCVSPDNTLVEAAGLMRELDVGALPVCDNDRLGGMVTDRDMVLRGTANGRDPNTTTIRDVMSPGIIYVFADQEVEAAVRLMEEKQIRRLPVLNREKRLVGMLSLGDVATSSNPVFSGMALRDVSQPAQPNARQQRLARESEPADREMIRARQTAPGGNRGRTRAGGSSSRRTGRQTRSRRTGRTSAGTKRGGSRSRSPSTSRRGTTGKKKSAGTRARTRRTSAR